MKVYIAGPMSGVANFNRSEFNRAHFDLWSEGHIVLNPARLPDGLSKPECMDIRLAMLRCADEIYLLYGWEESLGAIAEKTLAEKLGLTIKFQGEPK